MEVSRETATVGMLVRVTNEKWTHFPDNSAVGKVCHLDAGDPDIKVHFIPIGDYGSLNDQKHPDPELRGMWIRPGQGLVITEVTAAEFKQAVHTSFKQAVSSSYRAAEQAVAKLKEEAKEKEEEGSNSPRFTRVLEEYVDLVNEACPHFILEPLEPCPEKDDPWDRKEPYLRGMILGPQDSPYAGGLIHFCIKFPVRYPVVPPEIKLPGLYHPDVFCGQYNLGWRDNWGLLDGADADHHWSPLITSGKLLHELYDRLAHPTGAKWFMECTDHITEQLSNDRKRFNRTAVLRMPDRAAEDVGMLIADCIARREFKEARVLSHLHNLVKETRPPRGPNPYAVMGNYDLHIVNNSAMPWDSDPRVVDLPHEVVSFISNLHGGSGSFEGTQYKLLCERPDALPADRDAPFRSMEKLLAVFKKQRRVLYLGIEGVVDHDPHNDTDGMPVGWCNDAAEAGTFDQLILNLRRDVDDFRNMQLDVKNEKFAEVRRQCDALPTTERERFLAQIQAACIWSSPETGFLQGRESEVCWLINHALDTDERELLEPGWHLIEFLKRFCVVNRATMKYLAPHRLPEKDSVSGKRITYRGGGMNEEFCNFFENHKDFRFAGFVATSFSANIARNFMQMATDKRFPAVLWTFEIPDGCRHHMYLEGKYSLLDNEDELLLAPYTWCTVKDVNWGKMGAWRQTDFNSPHRITLEVHVDNRDAPEGIPIAPWR